MFDAFPFDEWSEEIAQFWTFGGQSGTSAGTIVLTVLGVILMVASFYGFVVLENGKLEHQANALKATGALDRPPDAPAES